MNDIRLVVVKLLQMAYLAALVPLLALRDTVISLLPFFLVLALLGLLAALLWPVLQQRFSGRQLGSARRDYLAAMLAWVEERLSGSVAMEGRDLPEITSYLRITGEPGSGKTMLLMSMLAEAIRRAQTDESYPLPVWVDLDAWVALPGEAGLRELAASPARLERFTPVRARNLGKIIAQEAAAKRIIFFVDGSVQTYSLTGFSSPNKKSPRNAANELAAMIETLPDCQFILAAPPGIREGALNRLVEAEYSLSTLSEMGIQDVVQALSSTGGQTQPAASDLDGMVAGILDSSGAWRLLSGRPALLVPLVMFYNKKGALPDNARALFQQTAYPPGTSAERVETILTRLADQVSHTGQYWQPLRGLLQSPAGTVASQEEIRAIEHARLVQLVHQDSASLVSFAHPIFLAYFIALLWHTTNVVTFPAGTDAEGITDDPVLSDALVFFNNIESDPNQLAAVLERLVSQDDAAEFLAGDSSGSAFARFLALQCLLAMPEANRPLDLVQYIAEKLIEQSAHDREAAEQASFLLDSMSETTRLKVYTRALERMNEDQRERTLHWIAVQSPGDVSAMLWKASEQHSFLVGSILAEVDPAGAFRIFREMFERGAEDRQAIAVDLLGRLPAQASAEYLTQIATVEHDPQQKIAILSSLVRTGAPVPFFLLEIITNRNEVDDVRTAAAKLLAGRRVPLAGNDQERFAREVFRASRMPLPEAAMDAIQSLLEGLRQTQPSNFEETAEETGANMNKPAPDTTPHRERTVNPYIIGHPVSDPRMFFGREQLLQTLRAAVENGVHTILNGEQRIGKTSVLRRLLAQIQDETARGIPVRAAYLDLQGLEPHEFFETTIRAVIEGLSDPSLAASQDVPRPYTARHFERDFGEVLAYLRETHGSTARLALLMDNADALLRYPQDMHEALRRILESEQTSGFTMIIAEIDPLARWSRAEPPFYNNFSIQPVPRMTPVEAHQLITQPVAGTFSYTPEAEELIQQAAQGRPARIAELCYALVGSLSESGERQVTAAQVNKLLQQQNDPRSELLSRSESLLNAMMDWMETHRDAPPAQVEEQLKITWDDLRKVIVQQVVRVRKQKG